MHIVTLGAGTGQGVLLSALRGRKDVRLTALVGVTDNGGHSGRLRRSLGIPQVGDTRACLAALAEPGVAANLVDFRFSEGPEAGVQIGNLLLAALVLREGSLARAAATLGDLLGLPPHRVLPISDGSADVVARLENGRDVRGEWRVLRRRSRSRIREVFHDPPLRAVPAALRALRDADQIWFAPGSLWTGLGSTLCVGGVRRALRAASAPLIYVANLAGQPGQTEHLDLAGHVCLLEKLVGRRLDAVLAHDGRFPRGVLRRMEREGLAPLSCEGAPAGRTRVAAFFDAAAAGRLPDRRPGRAISGPHWIRHDPEVLRRSSRKLMGLRRSEDLALGSEVQSARRPRRRRTRS